MNGGCCILTGQTQNPAHPPQFFRMPQYKRPIWSKVFIATEKGFLFIVYPCQHLFLLPTECVTYLLIFIIHQLGALHCCTHGPWVFFWCYTSGRVFSGKVPSFAISVRFSRTRLSPNSECARLVGQWKSLEGSVVKYCYKRFPNKLSPLKTDGDTSTYG